MSYMTDMADKIKRYYKFTPEEVRALVIAILVVSFIVGFNDGRKTFEFGHWISNFIFVLIMVTVTFLIYETGHRVAGFHAGFKVEYQLWWYGCLFGIIVALVTKGIIWWVLLPGGIMIHHMTIHRLGWFRYGTNVKAYGFIALAGPLSCIAFGTILKTVTLYFPYLPFPAATIDRIFVFNVVFGAVQLLPLPPLDGSRIFYYSRLWYAWLFGFLVSYAILAAFGVFSFIWAIILGTLFYVMFYLKFEMKVHGK